MSYLRLSNVDVNVDITKEQCECGGFWWAIPPAVSWKAIRLLEEFAPESIRRRAACPALTKVLSTILFDGLNTQQRVKSSGRPSRLELRRKYY